MIEIIPIASLITSRENLPEYVDGIIELLDGSSIVSRRAAIQKVIPRGKEIDDPEIKEVFLEIVLQIIEGLLNDNDLAKDEMTSIRYVKSILGIKEGDFLKYPQVKSKMELLILEQIAIMYQDYNVNSTESLHKVDLQESFGLGYDDFIQIVNKVDLEKLQKGANVLDLDTFIKNRILNGLT